MENTHDEHEAVWRPNERKGNKNVEKSGGGLWMDDNEEMKEKIQGWGSADVFFRAMFQKEYLKVLLARITNGSALNLPFVP